jgi:enoyl-CoA hydratase/carnithine racemase
MSAELYLEFEGELAFLIINRVEKRNALSLGMWKRIPSLFAEIENNHSIRVAIIRGGDDTAFAAGVDIDEFSGIAGSEELSWQLMDTVHAAEQSIANCSKPVIAMIEGHCVGGGIELALACDLRFASRESRFAVPPAKLGLVYSLSSTRRLIELVGIGSACDLLFSARSFDAREAAELGLVERIFEPSAIVDATLSYARMLCERSQYSIRASKKIIAAVSRGESSPSAEIQGLRGGAFVGEDLKEGMTAFFEKRAARFMWGR